MHEPRILSLNCGSSSLKFGLYAYQGERITSLFEGEAEEIGVRRARFWTRSGQNPKTEAAQPIADHAMAFDLAMRALSDAGLSNIDGAGHRVVHGGSRVRDHCRLDDEKIRELRAAVPFAPLHLPASLAVIDAMSKTMPDLPQVVCLDTAFHKELPDVAKTLPFSRRVREQGVERYGFHGLSLESIVQQLEIVPQKMVIAHLGNGSSISAVLSGKSIDTTMGMTPTGGIMMGTRPGDVDPGVLVYLLRHGTDSTQLESLVDEESGLIGVSEFTSDVRQLMEARHADEKSDLALRMFAYQAKKAIAGMAAALGGLDLLVFTGGIGQHAGELRDEIRGGLSFLGQFETKILPALEDLQIARIAQRLLGLKEPLPDALN